MHRVLQIDELIRWILDYCTIGSASRLGRTCRGLHEIACRVVWSSIPSLKPLAQLLAENARGNAEATLSPHERSETARDDIIRRLHSYGCRIKFLHIEEAAGDRDRLHDLLALCDGPELSLILRNVRSIHIGVCTVECAKDAVRFSASSSAELLFTVMLEGVSGDHPIPNPPPIGSLSLFLDPILQANKVLSISLGKHGPTAPDSSQFITAVCRKFPDIMRVGTVTVTDVDLLECLGALQSLHHVSFLLLDHITTPPILPFARLADLTVMLVSNEVHLFVELLSKTQAPQLKSLSLIFVSVGVIEVEDTILETSRLIGEHWTSLHRFFFRGHIVILNELPPDMNTIGWYFRWFMPLLACRSLVELHIEGSQPVIVTDEELEQASTSLTSLQRLCLAGNKEVTGQHPNPNTPPLSEPPRATFHGLRSLVKCPALMELRIYVDLRDATPSAFWKADLPSDSPLEILHVSDSPACEPDDLPAAVLLKELFPRLRVFRFDRPHSSPHGQDRQDPRLRSREVTRALCMAKIRRHLFGEGEPETEADDGTGAPEAAAELQAFIQEPV